MAKDRPIIRLKTAGTSKLRYGRATLTVRHWGDLNRGELGKAISAYEKGEIEAEALCLAFIRERIESTSPSFDWDEAELDRLVVLVVSASEEPKLSATEPEGLADELVAAAKAEIEEIKASAAKIREMGVGVIGSARRNLGALGNYEKVMAIARSGLAGDIGRAQAIRKDLVSKLGSIGGVEKLAGLGGSAGIRELIGPGSKINEILRTNYGLRGGIAEMIGAGRFQTPPWFREFPKPSEFLGDFGQIWRDWDAARKRALPINWGELDRAEIDAVVELMLAEGLSLAYAPRVEIIRALLAAPDHDARCHILESRSTEIIEDIEPALEGVYREDLKPIVGAAREAISTYEDGHPAPAQAYAASAVGEILHGPLGWESWGEVKRAFADKDPLVDVGFTLFPLYAVGRAWHRTLARFKDAGDGFNRNLTLHRIGFPYSEANLLSVLLLLAGLLRGLQPALDRHDKREEEEAA
jgi:hypothetical protein